MKKFLSIILALSVILSAFAGCADNAENGFENKPAQTTVSDEKPSGEVTESPSDGKETVGILSEFTSLDLEGNEIDASILSDYKLTMVNVWATFCSPCLDEMPDLGELAAEYKEKGVQIVGMVSDVHDSKGQISDSQIATAKDIVSATNANYLHIVPTEDLFFLLAQISSVPTTFFVDENGVQVGKTYIGSKSKATWQEIIDETLKEVE